MSFCKLSAGLSSTDNYGTSHFPQLRLLLSHSLWYTRKELFFLSSFSIRPQWIPNYSFFLSSDTANELARRVVLFQPSMVPYSLFPLISTHLFSQTGGTLSHQHSLTNRFYQYPLRNLCFFVTLVVSSCLRC